MMDSIDGRAWALAYVAYHNPEAISLAAQLFGVPPCPVCGYRAGNFCRCKQTTKTMGADKEDGLKGPVTPDESVWMSEFIRKLEEEAANVAYTTYCATVGGKAFNGDPLPTWEELVVTACADEKKAKVVAGWRTSTNATVAFALRKFLISADKTLMAAVDKTVAPNEPASSEATTSPAPA